MTKSYEDQGTGHDPGAVGHERQGRAAKPDRFARRIEAATPKITEAQVEAYFCKRVKAMGGDVRKVAWVGRRSAPDRYVMLPGSGPNFWAELKRPNYPVTPHVEAQRREHERMRAYDEIVHVISTYAEADAVLAPYRGNVR